MIKSAKPKMEEVEDFIGGSEFERPGFRRRSNQVLVSYLLRIPEKLRREIRHESIEENMNMSEYICHILKKRKRL